MTIAPLELSTRCNDPVQVSGAGCRRAIRRGKIQEKWMKLVKTSMIACALSALIATPVLAQGAPPAKTGGTVQGKPMQGGTMGSGDEEMSAQPGAAGEKTGMKSTKGTKGTVGTTGSAAHKGTADDSATGGAAPAKRY
ncbi:hypothetical protein M2232_005716 [Bradyrhizobium japonicum]|nr:hypothetical protein [Bradyrhizobium japonicum]MCW2222184.1 hypothetical protein [Bradyrhizobium japonicum]MCW2346796.1 hypothetical protein [Bradyrhizobium japonicum]